MSEWQDISTAPKDGTNIIVGRAIVRLSDLTYKPAIVLEAHFDEREGGWVYGGIWEPYLVDQEHPPTHWMPLPEPPHVET